MAKVRYHIPVMVLLLCHVGYADRERGPIAYSNRKRDVREHVIFRPPRPILFNRAYHHEKQDDHDYGWDVRRPGFKVGPHERLAITRQLLDTSDPFSHVQWQLKDGVTTATAVLHPLEAQLLARWNFPDGIILADGNLVITRITGGFKVEIAGLETTITNSESRAFTKFVRWVRRQDTEWKRLGGGFNGNREHLQDD